MMINLSKKKGFTLVELLIVMLIIGILSVLAVGGYTAYRKIALIDLNADTIVSQLNEMRDKAMHGTDSTQDISKCFGLKFAKNSDGVLEIQSVAQKFSGVKKWHSASAKWQYEGCAGDVTPERIFEIDPMVTLDAIPCGGNDFVLEFVPPNGDVNIKECGANGTIVPIKIRYGSDTDERYARTVSVDLLTGKVTKN